MVGPGLIVTVMLAALAMVGVPSSSAIGAVAVPTFTVNTTDDVDDGVCGPTHCSLREAIQAANDLSGKDTIAFGIAGSAPFTIALATELPAIEDSIEIDGTTQPGFSGAPVVELRGDGIPFVFPGARGLRLLVGDSLVRGLVMNRFEFAGITIESPAVGSNWIAGNFIGTDATGESAAGGGYGIRASAGSRHRIGGPTVLDRNVISGNDSNISIESSAVAENTIQGNYIGTDDDGATALGESGAGILIRSSDNQIGGADVGERNVISGNVNNILFDGATRNNTVQGNYIGTDAGGEDALGGFFGLVGSGIGSNHRIGGDDAGERNVISGNAGDGVFLFGSGHEIIGNLIGTDKDGTEPIPNTVGLELQGTTGVIARNVISGNLGDGLKVHSDCAGAIDCGGIDVQGNHIGVDLAGTKPLGNGGFGIAADGADGGLIGGTAIGERNVISANGTRQTGGGVGFFNLAARYELQGNYIGTDVNGGGVPFGEPGSFGNASHGVLCCGGFLGNPTEIVVGGVSPGAGNLIAFNAGVGVEVGTSSASRASILGNSIYENGGLGIDLDPAFLLPNQNDAGDGDAGANDLQNFPVLSGLSVSGGQTLLRAALNSTPGTTFRLEFFRNDSCNGNGAFPFENFGEGQTFAGAHEAMTDAGGNWDGTVVLSNVAVTDVITATATRFTANGGNESGVTSEFSECLIVAEQPGTIVVTKKTLPAGSPRSFDFTPSYGPGFSLRDGESSDSGPLTPGAGNSVSESIPEGWELASATCDDGSPVTNIDLAPAETVTCTFTNTRQGAALLLVLDEDAVDNGSPPNFFTARAVNDQIAKVGLRAPLPAFIGANVSGKLALHSGRVGDEGWFALKTIPSAWGAAGPTSNGARNFVQAGPGLGSGSRPQALLDKVPDVTPLRATGLKQLIGRQVCAVVYDNDVSINYQPLNGSLKGANLGLVAFEVLRVTRLTGHSSSSLPEVDIEVVDPASSCNGVLELLASAPAPASSSDPFDIAP